MAVGNPNVFIIESLDLADERRKEKFEGRVLSQILRLNSKRPVYYYIRTKKELKEIMKKFGQSDYRYLHISCHANPELIATTFDNMTFGDFAKVVGQYLNGRRLFLSACAAVNDNLAGAIFPNSECQSVIGPSRAIDFSDAAIAWASFYHIMFQENPEKIVLETICKGLRAISSTFGVNMRYYTRDDEAEERFRRVLYLNSHKGE